MSLRPLLVGGLLLALSINGGASSAASFSVSPVRLTLTATAPIVALTVRNVGVDPAVVQLEVMNWTQQDGADRYEPSRDLIATPPIFTIAPQGSQTVRLAMRRAPDPRRELTYRVYLTEVPPPPRADVTGTRMTLQLGVPVFVAPPAAGPQSLQWQMLRDAHGKLSIAARNSGALHARILTVTLSPKGGPKLMPQQVATDVLAGQQRAFPLGVEPMPAAGTTLHLVANTERGDVEADVVVP